MHRKLLFGAAALLALMALAGGTLASYSARAAVVNTVTIGKVSVELTEPKFSKNPGYQLKVEPSVQIVKDPTVTNTGSHPAYLCVTATIQWAKAPEAEAELPTFAQLGITAAKGFTATGLESTTANFCYGQPLVPGASVAVFAPLPGQTDYTMQIPAQWGKEYAGSAFTITLQAKAIQSENITQAQAFERLANL